MSWWWIAYAAIGLLFAWPATVTMVVMCRWWTCSKKAAWNVEGADPSDTLQYRSAREDADERHICPLQLEVIRRAMKLWTNEGDVVLSPFAGIGSEGHVALTMGRRFVGAELKRSYYEQACRNLEAAAGVTPQTSLFDALSAE